ncbi:hypothetical protein [Thermosporothrix hazakensis]|nr:hypothetical protein [Thermosporothrix hazakensis]
MMKHSAARAAIVLRGAYTQREHSAPPSSLGPFLYTTRNIQ